MEEDSLLLRVLGKSPRLMIIDFLIDNPIFDFSKTEMIAGIELCKPTFYKYFSPLLDEGIVKISRKIGRSEMYQLDRKNPTVIAILEFEEKILRIHEGKNAKT